MQSRAFSHLICIFRILSGHGADVKCVHWHPYKSLVASGSKDNQQPVKLWDPRSGKSIATMYDRVIHRLDSIS